MSPPASDSVPRHRRASSKDSDEAPSSSNLWVGNLSLDTTEPELAALFSKYGELDRVTAYPSRNYAFVYFVRAEDARNAKETLQGALVRGNSIKIQCAKPARASKHLWIGGISPGATKKELEDEFSKFGEIADFKLLRDRNFAFIDYYKVEDAADAMKNMNGKSFGGERIQVDYVRSQPSRKDWSDPRDSYMPSESAGPHPRSTYPPILGHKRPMPQEDWEEGKPSKVLLIRYPPSAPIDDHMLHNAMILFGEIEGIKSFPGRNVSLVEFRSVEEAWRAKEGLQGRLFNDPRIQIVFSHREVVSTRDGSPFFPGNRDGRPDMFFHEPSFGPIDMFPPNHSVGLNGFPGSVPPNLRAPNMPMRPFPPHPLDPIHGGPEFSNTGNPMPWRRLSPSASGVLNHRAGMGPTRHWQGAWDDFDSRDSKRSRVDAPPLIEDVPFHARRMAGQDLYGIPQGERDSHGQVRPSPIRMKGSSPALSGRTESHSVHSDHCWRGLIAKGGSPVCHARCIPIDNGIESPIPEVVNCSARTGLDMLAKHYAEATGFDIVFFLPDSEEDFASYTEFLHYLGAKNRAGVAKFDDGTTLFLVPPSDFLTKVLKVSGPERLYGVVLKMPQQASTVTMSNPQAPPTTEYVDRQQLPSQAGYGSAPYGQDPTMSEYNRAPQGDMLSRADGGKLLLPHAEESHAPSTFVRASNVAPVQPAGVNLTPELLASLASLVPSVVQSSAGPGASQLPQSAAMRPPLPTEAIPERLMLQQGWSQDNRGVVPGVLHQEQIHHPSQQVAHHLNSSSHLPQFSNHSIRNASDLPMNHVSGSMQIQDPMMNLQHINSMNTRQMGNHQTYPSQGGIPTVPSNQQQPLDGSFGYQKGYGMAPQSADSSNVYNGSLQQPMSYMPFSHDQSGLAAQSQNILPLATDGAKVELPSQLQQLQASLSNSVQGTSGDADKNQRYQSTLQFAANLLLQIQQQQQQKQGDVSSMQQPGNRQ